MLLLQVLLYVRNGEKVDRVRTLWLTPTSFFRQFAPELVMYSLGSRGVHALYLFLFWKQAQRRNDRVYATRQR